MSRTIGASLLTHFGSAVTTICTCYKITRKDGEIFGFTDHDTDLVVSGITYRSMIGSNTSSLKTSADMGIDNIEADILLSSSGITEEDIRAGRYENATLLIFQVNYEAIATQGIVTLAYGRIGEIKLKDEYATAEYRSLTQLLQKNIGRTYLSSCDAKLGDSRCNVNMATYQQSSSVVSVTSRSVFNTLAAGSADYTNGRILWTNPSESGNYNLSMEIKSWSSNQMALILPMPFTIEIDDEFTAYYGCNKSFSDCKTRFSNADNFRGFPHIPGFDKIVSYADQ